MFKRYFTLEEAVATLPAVREQLERARAEIGELQQSIVLQKRIGMLREQAGEELPAELTEALEARVEAYESCFHWWARHFNEQGILLRDLHRGLIDFPYRTAEGEELLLCWESGDEGLFYFHTLTEGYRGRQPISLLPESAGQ